MKKLLIASLLVFSMSGFGYTEDSLGIITPTEKELADFFGDNPICQTIGSNVLLRGRIGVSIPEGQASIDAADEGMAYIGRAIVEAGGGIDAELTKKQAVAVAYRFAASNCPKPKSGTGKYFKLSSSNFVETFWKSFDKYKRDDEFLKLF